MRIRPALPTLSAFLCFASPLAAQGAAPHSPADTAAASWVRQHAIPLRYVEAGHGFADLQPLSRVLKDFQIVGLGEATMRIRDQLDGLLFIQRTTATRPTPNALKTVANRKGI